MEDMEEGVEPVPNGVCPASEEEEEVSSEEEEYEELHLDSSQTVSGLPDLGQFSGVEVSGV